MANILVVDDEQGIRELFFEILSDEGHQVALAQNAAAARKLRLATEPDLVFLDIWMPGTDGMALLKEWAAAGLLNIPVIMMSGHANLETAVQVGKTGASGFLEKPITLQKLLDTVREALPRRGVASASAVVATASAGAQTASPSALGHPGVANFDFDQPLRQARDAFEKAYLEYHLNKANDSMPALAQATGLERTHLYRKLKQLDIGVAGRPKTQGVGRV